MSFGSRTAAQYDVGFNVLLGPFRAQLGEAAAVYGRTTGQMSTESLRLATKQYDLAKAIQVYGETSVQAARKTVLLRDEMVSLAAASEKSNAGLLSHERTLGRFARGSFVGSGFGRSGLLFGSGAFVGGLAAISGLKAALDAAKGEEVALGLVQVALKDTGLSWEQYGRRIEAALTSQVKVTAFNRGELATALAANVRRFGDVSLALRANAIDADVARAMGISLADAQNIVQRASLGQSRSLLALGITYTKTTANVDALKASTKYATAEQIASAKAADLLANRTGALDAIFAHFHGNAARFLTTTAGKQALFSAELHQTEAIIGTALLPTFGHLLTHLAAYLDKLNRTGRLQHDVNTAVHDAGKFFHTLESVIRDVDKVTGGFKDTLGLLLGLKLISALGGFRLGFAKLAGAEGIGGAEVAAGGLLASLTTLGGLAPIAIPITLLLSTKPGRQAAESNVNSGTSLFHDFFSGKGFHPLSGFNDKTATDLSHLLFGTPLQGNGRLGGPGPNVPRSHVPGLPSVGQIAAGFGKKGFTGNTGAKPGTSTPPPGPLVLGLTEAQQTALLRAEGTKSTADDVQALNAQLGILNRLVTQKGLNAAQLNSLLAQRDSVLSQLDSLTTKTSTAAERAAKKAAEAKKKAAAAAAKAIREGYSHRENLLKLAVEKALLTTGTSDDIAALTKLEDFYKREAGNPRLTQKMRDVAAAKATSELLKLKKLGVAQHNAFQVLERQFLSTFSSIVGTDSSNIGSNAVTSLGSGERGHTTVNVHQHFNAPPSPNRHREAAYARIAMQSRFDA